MKQVIIVENEKYFFKGKTYDEAGILNRIGKNVEFIILEENIFVKNFSNIKKIKENTISKIIKVEYGDDFDLLTHYEYSKKLKSLFLYSIGNGERINKISKNINTLAVVPIQFYIKNYVNKKVKGFISGKSNYVIIALIKEKVYLIEIEDGFIIKSNIENLEGFSLDDKLQKYERGTRIIADDSLKEIKNREILNDYNISIIKMERMINEKLFKI